MNIAKNEVEGLCVGESVFQHDADLDRLDGIEGILGREPTPALAVSLSEQYEKMLDMLADGPFRNTAELKLLGYKNSEIAQKMECSVRTVDRRLNHIRNKWQVADFS